MTDTRRALRRMIFNTVLTCERKSANGESSDAQWERISNLLDRLEVLVEKESGAR